MSTEILNNSSKFKEKKTSINKINIGELKRKIILKQKREKLHQNILLATICVSLIAVGYLVL
tara:strand:- start:97 stop:282 length:186 start_codon:yes stop_codon:yes gene_type:complete